jgi:hypothetical protein
VYDLFRVSDALRAAERALIGASSGQFAYPSARFRFEGVEETLGLMPAYGRGEQPAFGLEASPPRVLLLPGFSSRGPSRLGQARTSRSRRRRRPRCSLAGAGPA